MHLTIVVIGYLSSNIHTQLHPPLRHCLCKRKEKGYILSLSLVRPLPLFSFEGVDWPLPLLKGRSFLIFVVGQLEGSFSPVHRRPLPENWIRYPERDLLDNLQLARDGTSHNS